MEVPETGQARNQVETPMGRRVFWEGHNASGVRRKFSWGGFIQWHRVVICICCALFVTSQFEVIVLFPNQRFSEVRWHNMHVLLYIHSLYFMCHCTEYNLLAVVGLGMGGPRQDKKEGLPDDIIILSQPW